MAKENSLLRVSEYTTRLARIDIQISRSYIQRIFAKWNWSWKVVSNKQIHKYTPSNIIYYGNFLHWINTVDLRKVKFLDECHLVSRGKVDFTIPAYFHSDLYRRRGISGIGIPCIAVQTEKLDISFSLTIMTHFRDPRTCSGRPAIVPVMRTNSNSQWDFLMFVLMVVQKGELRRGDFLVCDNASIHGGQDSIELLDKLCTAAGVKIVFLPSYSPELNPCEMVSLAAGLV